MPVAILAQAASSHSEEYDEPWMLMVGYAPQSVRYVKFAGGRRAWWCADRATYSSAEHVSQCVLVASGVPSAGYHNADTHACRIVPPPEWLKDTRRSLTMAWVYGTLSCRIAARAGGASASSGGAAGSCEPMLQTAPATPHTWSLVPGR